MVTVRIPEHAGQRSGHGGQHSADPPNRPSSARTGVRHAAGMVSAITPESCPSWAGVRTTSPSRQERCQFDRRKGAATHGRQSQVEGDIAARCVGDPPVALPLSRRPEPLQAPKRRIVAIELALGKAPPRSASPCAGATNIDYRPLTRAPPSASMRLSAERLGYAKVGKLNRKASTYLREAVGESVKKHRDYRGYTQQELAALPAMRRTTSG
jgi:hypothetical protein